jgi:hypothetical protein
VTLDDALPQYDFHETHATWVAAPPERALAAAEEVTLAEIPVARALLALRALPALVSRKRAAPLSVERPIRELLESNGFVRLGEEPGREVVYGVAGAFWRPVGNRPIALGDAAAFAAFVDPGNAKAALAFRVEAENGGARLTTETRVAATDAAAHRSFGRYWRVIRPGSGLIRRAWLGAAQRRAEARS